MSRLEVHSSLRLGGPGLFCGVLLGVVKGVEDGVLAMELSAEELLLVFSSCGPFPFSTGLSRALNNLAPFFAFLNSTEVRRPTPPVGGREVMPSSARPLVTVCPSLCKLGRGEVDRSCALMQ